MSTARVPEPLDRDVVVRAGRGIVERDGARALTMQALAGDLGVSTMAAYRYVPSKSDLLVLIADDVMSGVVVPDGASGDWYSRLERLERSAFAELSSTADLWSVIPPDAVFPQQQRLSSAVVDLLLEAGFEQPEASLAYEAIFGYVFGQLRLRAQLDPPHSRPSGDYTGARERNVVFGAGRPEVAMGGIAFQEYFDFGLRIMLDGLRLDLESRSSRPEKPGLKPSARP